MKNTVLILYLGSITSVSAIAYLLITRTSIGTLDIIYQRRAIASIITQTIVIALNYMGIKHQWSLF